MTTPRAVAFLMGIVCGSFVTGLFLEPDRTKTVTETVQSAIIIFVTLFTAWWTSRTFGFKQKNDEAREINIILNKLQIAANSIISFQDLEDMFKLSRQNLLNDDYYTKRREQTELEFRVVVSELKNATTTCVTIKPFTRVLLSSLSELTTHQVLSDRGLKLQGDIIDLQFRLINESNFDIGIEWNKFRNKFGI